MRESFLVDLLFAVYDMKADLLGIDQMTFSSLCKLCFVSKNEETRDEKYNFFDKFAAGHNEMELSYNRHFFKCRTFLVNHPVYLQCS